MSFKGPKFSKSRGLKEGMSQGLNAFRRARIRNLKLKRKNAKDKSNYFKRFAIKGYKEGRELYYKWTGVVKEITRQINLLRGARRRK